jgi:RHS repeat-associated protein
MKLVYNYNITTSLTVTLTSDFCYLNAHRYALFGEILTEYNAYWHQGKVPDYMFNAKEMDSESGMYYYSARYYNPPTFISRDPLFEKYFWCSPYAMTLNNPVKYIDPDGNAPTPPRSRIEYRGNGVFGLNVNNLNKGTRDGLYRANLDSRNWSPNSIGISTKVAAIQLKQSSRPSTVGVDQQHTTTKTVSERIAQSTGMPDKRSERTISTVGGGAVSRGGGAFMLAINAVNLAYDYWSTFSILNDNNAITQQSSLLQQSYNEVMKSGLVPSQYQNLDDLGAITNFVFQGINNTNNQDITKIGTNILMKMGRYDKKTKQVKPLIEE